MKLGKVNAEIKRKVSSGKAILKGGGIGVVAISGDYWDSEVLFFLEFAAGKPYYMTARIAKQQ